MNDELKELTDKVDRISTQVTNVVNSPEAQKAKSLAYHYWYVIVIVLLAAYTWNTHRLKTNAENEANALKHRVTLQGDLAEAEKRLQDMKDREAALYKEIERKVSELNTMDGNIAKKRKELILVKKEKLKDEVSKMDSNTLAGEFGKLGYPAKVNSSR